jgi:hypothetical protein
MKKTTSERIYKLLITNHNQSQICRIIRRDKSVVSRVTSALIDGGFVQCINQRDREKFYEATKKKFLREDAVILSTIQLEKKPFQNERGSFLRVHAMKYVSTVERMGKVPWDKKWTAKETNHYFLHYPFLNFGKIGFEWVFGKEKSVLIIHLPSVKWNPQNGNPEIYMRSMADQAGTWFMKKYHCDLRGIRQCGKGHFEMPVHDEHLVRLAQETSVRVGDFVLDSSLGYPEFGSVGGYEILSELLSLPKRVAVLEAQMVVVVRSIGEVAESIKTLQRSIDELNVLLRQPVRVDEFRDVA